MILQSDMTTISENITYLPACAGGIRLAPIPPMLALARDSLGVQFSGPVVDGNLPTEIGPSLGIENTSQYTWSVTGLRDYAAAKRTMSGAGQTPSDLQQELSLK